MSNIIEQNIRGLQKRIARACERVGRSPDEVQIVLATKTVEPEYMLKAQASGLYTVAENRVQEAERKIEQMGQDAARLDWHFIGHLQSNKVNKVVRFASMLQSIDRMKIVKKLNRRLQKVGQTMDVLIQVNTSGEESKYGIKPTQAVEFVQRASRYPQIKIRGLMTIGLFSDNWLKVRAGFRQLRMLRDDIKEHDIKNVEMEYLSMGMTNDFEIAIEEGANMIRVGRAIFGDRSHPDSYYWPGIDAPKEC